MNNRRAIKYKIGKFLFTPTSRGLEDLEINKTLTLRPKENEVLRVLCEAYPDIVSRNEIEEKTWGNTTIVTDNSLNQVIKELRKALDDRVNNIIKTIPRLGYTLNISPKLVSEDAKEEPVKIIEKKAIDTSITFFKMNKKFKSIILLGVFFISFTAVKDFYNIPLQLDKVKKIPIYYNIDNEEKTKLLQDKKTTDNAVYLKKHNGKITICNTYKNGVKCS